MRSDKNYLQRLVSALIAAVLFSPAIYCETTGVWYGALSSRGYLTSLAAFGGTACRPISE